MTDELIDSEARVRAWLVAYLADILDIPEDQVDVDQPFEQYGLDSAATVAFTSDLSNWLGIKLDSHLMVEHDSVEAVVRQIRAVHARAVPA